MFDEIKKSLEILEKILEHKIEHFAYPYGGKNEVSLRECKIIENLDFISGVTGKVFSMKHDDPFHLPRIYIGENTCEKTLTNHLSGFYNLANKFF